MDVTRAALLDGTRNFTIARTMARMAEEALDAMVRAFDGGPDFPPQSISLAFDIYTSESL